jgi:hypothetical protein
MPRARGGTNAPENQALAHKGCNGAKRDRIGPELAAIFPNAREVLPM